MEREGTTKELCDNDFVELPGELSSAIFLRNLVLLGNALELFRTYFGAALRCLDLCFF